VEAVSAEDPMYEAEKARVLDLARKGIKMPAIRERVGWNQDRLRRAIERAEQRGEVPPGTLARCCVSPRIKKGAAKAAVKAVVEESDQPKELQVYAPARKIAADMGSCRCCNETTEVVIEFNRGGTERVRVCRQHGTALARALLLALEDALKARQRFNGRIM
jgi:hypothetical protein